MIAPADITGADSGIARRVIAYARSIAPCLDSLSGEYRLDAIAILQAIAAEGQARGSRQIKSQRINTASVEYVSTRSLFGDDDRDALRALCTLTVAATAAGLPVGQFPLGGAVNAQWPEQYETPTV